MTLAMRVGKSNHDLLVDAQKRLQTLEVVGDPRQLTLASP
jgi:hypothetical protein